MRFAGRPTSTGGLPDSRTDPIAQLQLKHILRELLDERRLEEIAEMAARRKRVLGSLVSLTYDADPQISLNKMGICFSGGLNLYFNASAMLKLQYAEQRFSHSDEGQMDMHFAAVRLVLVF